MTQFTIDFRTRKISTGFFLQEIDGQALMLLKADHLMSAMAIKLGPALKICSAIDAMREELKQVNYHVLAMLTRLPWIMRVIYITYRAPSNE